MIEKILMAVVLIYGGSYYMKNKKINLKYFSPSEFGIWWPLMDKDWLYKLDEFREVLGVPVIISTALGSLGRPGSTGQHNPGPTVKAGDVMSDASMQQMYEAARKVGFTGIGLYPDWEPKQGAHLDTRTDRTADNPAVWSAIKIADGSQQYVEIERALV